MEYRKWLRVTDRVMRIWHEDRERDTTTVLYESTVVSFLTGCRDPSLVEPPRFSTELN